MYALYRYIFAYMGVCVYIHTGSSFFSFLHWLLVFFLFLTFQHLKSVILVIVVAVLVLCLLLTSLLALESTLI